RIAAAPDSESLEREAAGAADRYGAPPEDFDRLLAVARLRLLCLAIGVKALQRRGDELAATLEKKHALDAARVMAALRKGELQASGPDAFRAPRVFAGVPPGSGEACERAASFLSALVTDGAALHPAAGGGESERRSA